VKIILAEEVAARLRRRLMAFMVFRDTEEGQLMELERSCSWEKRKEGLETAKGDPCILYCVQRYGIGSSCLKEVCIVLTRKPQPFDS
jgi:hypothetical protein